jgi:predicted house-cleaning noncanonical NTP pyrophosphatase (MazG superfamily)
MKVKLIRDKCVPYPGTSIKPANGRAGKHALLCLKLHEEAAEIADNPTSPEEYADLLEVMLELMRVNGITWSQVEGARTMKLEEKGGFSRGMVLQKP